MIPRCTLSLRTLFLKREDFQKFSDYSDPRDTFKPTRSQRWPFPWSPFPKSFSKQQSIQLLTFLQHGDFKPLDSFDFSSLPHLVPQDPSNIYMNLAELFWVGSEIVDRDQGKSQHFNAIASNLGNHEATFRRGVQAFIDSSYFLQERMQATQDWFHKAATLGNHPEAQFCLGWIMNRNDFLEPTDEKRLLNHENSIHWLRSAAMQGHVSSQYLLGLITHNPDPDDRRTSTVDAHLTGSYDFLNAFHLENSLNWIETAAENGLPSANHQLGVMAFAGQTVSQNEDMALECFFRAASSFYWPSWVAIGSMYASGMVRPDVTLDLESKYPQLVKFISEFTENEPINTLPVFSETNPLFSFEYFQEYEHTPAPPGVVTRRTRIGFKPFQEYFGSYRPDFQRALDWFSVPAQVGDIHLAHVWIDHIKSKDPSFWLE